MLPLSAGNILVTKALGTTKGRAVAIALSVRALAFAAAAHAVHTLLYFLPSPLLYVVAAAAGAAAFNGWLWVYLLVLSLSYAAAAVIGAPAPSATVALSVLLAFLAFARPSRPALLGGAVLLAAAYTTSKALVGLAKSLPGIAGGAGVPGVALAPFFATPVGGIVSLFAAAVVLFVVAGWVGDLVAGMRIYLERKQAAAPVIAKSWLETILVQDKRIIEFFADTGLWVVASILFAPVFTVVVDVVLSLLPYKPGGLPGMAVSYLAPLALSLTVWWLASKAVRTADIRDLAYIALIGMVGLVTLLVVTGPGSLGPVVAAALGLPAAEDDPLTTLVDEEGYLAYIETSLKAIDELASLLIRLLWPA